MDLFQIETTAFRILAFANELQSDAQWLAVNSKRGADFDKLRERARTIRRLTAHVEKQIDGYNAMLIDAMLIEAEEAVS